MGTEDSPPAKGEERRENIIAVLDELIFHLNNTKSTFTVLIVSSLILGPISLAMAGVFIVHPRFLMFLLHRLPDVGIMITVYVVISIIFSSIWLFIGTRERSFFSKWSNRFGRFMSLKEQIDKELED